MKLADSKKFALRFSELSYRKMPETLFHGGKISHADVIREQVKIKKEWRVAELEFGRAVSEEEVWDTVAVNV